MKSKRALRILSAMVAGSVVVLVASMAIVGHRLGPQAAKADAGQAAIKAEIDEAVRQADRPRGLEAPQSNPWIIFDESPSLDRVVALGTPAVPVLIAEIENRPRSGLDEYLMAICVVRIIKTNFTGDAGSDTFWDRGKRFPAAFQTHLSRVPETVSSIAASEVPAAEKNAQLEKLGTPAIPFILDEVEAGRSELAPAAQSLMDGTEEMGGQSAEGSSTAEWARQNKERFAQLRGLVSAARK